MRVGVCVCVCLISCFLCIDLWAFLCCSASCAGSWSFCKHVFVNRTASHEQANCCLFSFACMMEIPAYVSLVCFTTDLADAKLHVSFAAFRSSIAFCDDQHQSVFRWRAFVRNGCARWLSTLMWHTRQLIGTKPQGPENYLYTPETLSSMKTSWLCVANALLENLKLWIVSNHMPG